jgi:hypothetical protein
LDGAPLLLLDSAVASIASTRSWLLRKPAI